MNIYGTPAKSGRSVFYCRDMRCGGSWAVAWGRGFWVAERALPSAYARGGGVIFEGRADKPLGVVGVNLTRGVVNFGKTRGGVRTF